MMLFRKHTFHRGFKRDLKITTESFKAALKADYINSDYMHFANADLQASFVESRFNQNYLNISEMSCMENLMQLTQLFFLKWLIETKYCEALEGLLAADFSNNPLMHYEDDVYREFVRLHYEELKCFVDNEWSPFFKDIIRNLSLLSR